MASDQGPVVQSALLRRELVNLRKECELTQQQVAATLEWSPSKLIRVEGGASSITKVDLDALLTKYGVTSESRRERLQALNRGARQRGWWDSYKDDISSTYLSYVGFEAGSAVIKQLQMGVIPGLLQTAEYAEAVTVVGPVDPGRVESMVGLRLKRQSELAQRGPKPRQFFLIDEGVIRRHIGITKDPAIMPAQLRRVADRAERDELLTVQVIPFEAGEHPGLIDPFIILEFDNQLPDLLFLDTDREAFTMISGDEPEVPERSEVFDKVQEYALPAKESIDLLRTVAQEMSVG